MINILTLIKDKVYKIKKIIILALITSFTTILILSSCSMKGVEIKILDVPYGVSKIESGNVITLFDSFPIKSNKTAIYVDKFKKQSDSIAKDNVSSSHLIAAKFDDKIKLLDFVVPEINEKPELSFKSSARSLVFMNPIFLGLSTESQKNLFKLIEQDKDFNGLVNLISKSESVFDDEVINLSSQIAINIAAKNSQQVNTANSSNTGDLLSEKSSSNPFKNEKFPKSSCGDSLPSGVKEYPVNFYPVYVEYSEGNLNIIKNKFCNDAYKKLRGKTGQEVIQVGSFRTIERAEYFKQLMIESVESGEIGKPTTIEKRSDGSVSNKSFLAKIFNKIENYFLSPAYAQNRFEYKVVQQFNDSGTIGSWPLWHGLTAVVNSSELEITGTSPIAQQLIVVATDKLPPSRLSHDDYSRNKTHEGDILGELLVLPSEVGIWNLSFAKTLSGNNQTTQTLKPKDGSNWQQGNYSIVLSGGSFLNRRTDSQKVGAFDINVAMLVTDTLSVTAGLGNDRVTEVAADLISVSDDCIKEVLTKSNNTFARLNNCLAKTDNVVKIAKIFGLTDEEITKSLLSEILNFEGKAWESFKDKAGKRLAKAINIIDKTLITGRIGVLGLYLDNENQQGYYFAKFEVRDQEAPQGFTVDLLAQKPHILMDDLELKAGREIASIRNYSHNWYSIESIDPEGSFERDILLIGPAGKFSGSIQDLFLGSGEESIFNLSKEKRSTYLSCQFQTKCPVRSIGLKLDIQRYLESPTRTVTISCDKKPLRIWGLIMNPRCTSNGSFVELKRYNTYLPPVKVILDNGRILNFSNPIINESGSLTSTGRTFSFTVSAKDVVSTRQ